MQCPVHDDAKAFPMHTFPIDRTYLLLPVRTGDPKLRVALDVAGQTVREFDIEFAAEAAQFEAVLDVSAFAGQEGTLRVVGGDDPGLAVVRLSDELPDAGGVYREAQRPQFHFTSQRGWLNDPNGLVYADGLWHLYYQHNPYGWAWGNMHWGHAVSEDLVHWRELGVSLYPKEYGDWAFSGSGFVAPDGRLGIAYTSTGRGECLAFSADGGATFEEILGNPVVAHRGRDPKVFWHAESEHWVMAVYDEADDERWIAIYTSTDLREWIYASRVGGFYECPELFPLAVDGDPEQVKWVLHGADGEYMLGDFDGRDFHPDGDKQRLWSGNFYASQTYTDAPDGRRVQIGWGRGVEFPGMPFNQQMGVACDLSLITTDNGVVMRAEPVPELASLRHSSRVLADQAGEGTLAADIGELVDLEATLSIPAAERGGLTVRGVPVVWDRAAGVLEVADIKAPVAVAGDVLSLRILVDRGSVEVFAADGLVAVAKGIRPEANDRTLRVTGAQTKVSAVTAHQLGSIWGR
ncbi:MAG: glycoside hydrolase family 32 protein [Victivallales bacterium]|nr:glycoside hydrolase family 32 protein [Victivallales bacterium]